MLHVRPIETPFDIRDQRAMVSLGAPNAKRHCAYSCPFCYVQAGFRSYPSLSIPDIIKWLNKQQIDAFDIIYVSGDTDSFAAPRTDQALILLEELLTLRKDVLFTTRMVMDESSLNRLGTIVDHFKQRSLRLFGCMSIAQKTVPRLEPSPIASPAARIVQLHRFRDLGLMTILAVRPFLPIVPMSDYNWILRESLKCVHAVLGEVWYADSEGVLESKVLGAGRRLDIYRMANMPFDSNEAVWKVYDAENVQAFFRDWCARAGLPFFMRSRPAIEWIRQNVSLK